MKTVLDSVHGTIKIPKELFSLVIDTPHFQRLRRIEQNSCRSVYPSARHDRFIHSLGVYHIGSLIAEEIERKNKQNTSNNIKQGIVLPKNWPTIKETYKLACLLHDVGHTPFSHTFEEFFDRKVALDELMKLLQDKAFEEDRKHAKSRPAEHEAISALVAVKVYKEKFDNYKIWKNKIDWVLLCRMITGYRYLNGETPNGSFENAMIELIHGEIIDADGLDYVCRDVWAGGYRNYNINLNRLIGSINIYGEGIFERNKRTDEINIKVKETHEFSDMATPKNYKYSVIYSSKALNEIETVLNVKNFQYLYVIKHHKVLLEQYYLVEAMKTAARYHLAPELKRKVTGEKALRKLCDLAVFTESKSLPKLNYKLYRPTDDDFVTLMKLAEDNVGKETSYIKGWFSREFIHKPLWKSKLEYFNIFASTFETLNENSHFEITEVLKTDAFKEFLVEHTKLNKDDIIVIDILYKIRHLDPHKIKVQINDEYKAYSTLNHDYFSVVGTKKPFCYVYINFNNYGEDHSKESKNEIIELIKDFISQQLRHLWKA